MKPLSKSQRELYEDMLRGAVVHYMPYMGQFMPTPYYFQAGGHRCTAAATALLEKGYAEKYDKDWRGHKLRLKQKSP